MVVGSNQSTTGQGTSAIGQSDQSSSSSHLQPGGMQYNTPAIQVGNAVRDGDQFILLVKSRQSEGFTVWSSGDKQQTSSLFRQASQQVDQLTTA